jgi:hypothetical protein
VTGLIGVGRITCGLREPRNLRLPVGAIQCDYVDVDRQGPGFARNQVLKQLMDEGCEFMFLFDDDCYPLMDGWADYFVSQSILTGVQFLGLPEAFKSNFHHCGRHEVVYWDRIIGCFNFQTREFMEKIGYYNAAYKGYGWEDSGRNHRALRSGLIGNNYGRFPSLLRATSYIFSEDVYALNPTPNMTFEQKQEGIEYNRAINIREGASSQLYYPYLHYAPPEGFEV